MPNRFEDSPGLFGNGLGTATYGDIKCDLCGTLYNEGEDARGVYDGESIHHTSFLGLTICECCFDKVENEVLKHMEDILDWYSRLLSERSEKIKKREQLLLSTIDAKTLYDHLKET